ncbi:suppressor of fused domain protein [Aquimarina algicola]|uniref:Suppressor of fused domain protein n=1 Tax=Aquimarina algicola TaxID=2589995 RepID=A0A504JR97_9FLAO|nr:suppressor of fused domain protein [Aquimarina algicola]TPN88880.1 suppressor of fused domain protein [Aquimarina algicola]
MSFFKKIFSSKEKEFQKADILLEQKSPCCPITAIVEQDNRVAHFYLWGPENSNFGVKSCWIRNLKDAPKALEIELMDKGIPPMLPKEFCKFQKGQEKLNKNDLDIVWTEEGDAAALLVKDEIIAIIPIWSGQNGFHGYAKDCLGQGDFAWELTESNVFIERIHKSKEYWNSWNDELNPFQILQPFILDTYDEIFGKHDQYFAIDGNEWPPKGLYLRKGEFKTIFATVGVSLLPMPVVEMYSENRLESNRIELGMICDSVFSENDIQQIAEWISGQTTIPWGNITFLGEGHTIGFIPLHSTKYNSVLLTNRLDILPKPELGDYRESKINFFWMVPISENERNEIMKNGSEVILERLNKIGEKLFSLDREEVL